MANPNIVKPGVTYAQDYNLKTLVLLTPGGTFDLKNSLVELGYFEDIFSNSISGYLQISDSQGLIEKLQLIGNEYIRVSFTKASTTDFINDMLFRVNKISSRQLIGNTTTEGYVLNFCSDELILSEQYKVSKSYKDKKISDIINDILTGYLKVDPNNKVVDIEETKGIYSFIVPNMKPFEAINWVSTYAQSATPGSYGSDMLLFEDSQGFHFFSLQTLFTQVPERTYTYAPKNLDNKTATQDQKFYGVNSYQVVDAFDTLHAVNSGIFANRLITIDPLLQRWNIVDFNYKTYFNNSTQLNKYSIVNDATNRLGDKVYETPQAVLKFAASNKDQKNIPYIGNKPSAYSHDIFLETYIPTRTSQLSLSNYNKVKLFMNGDPTVTAGSTINFNLVSMDPATQGKELDKYYSGKYLISAMKHVIKVDGYKMIVEVIKESVPNQYVSPDTSSALWKNTIEGKL
jgi:hypothetical protein